jgi:type II secretory pathway pseudopilin PulG
MSVRGKLLVALAPLGVALVVLGVLSVLTIQTLGQSSARILQENYLSTLAIQRMLDALENLDETATMATLAPVSNLDATARKLIDDDRARFTAALGVEEGNITEPGEGELSQRLRAGWENYDRALTALLATADDTERRRIFSSEMRPAYGEVRTSANQILALNQDAMVIKGDRTQRAVRQMNTVLVASAIAAFGIGLVLSLSCWVVCCDASSDSRTPSSASARRTSRPGSWNRATTRSRSSPPTSTAWPRISRSTGGARSVSSYRRSRPRRPRSTASRTRCWCSRAKAC